MDKYFDDEFTHEELLDKLGILDYIQPLLDKAYRHGRADMLAECNEKGLVKTVAKEPDVKKECVRIDEGCSMSLNGILIHTAKGNLYIYYSEEGNLVVCKEPKK